MIHVMKVLYMKLKQRVSITRRCSKQPLPERDNAYHGDTEGAVFGDPPRNDIKTSGSSAKEAARDPCHQQCDVSDNKAQIRSTDDTDDYMNARTRRLSSVKRPSAFLETSTIHQQDSRANYDQVKLAAALNSKTFCDRLRLHSFSYSNHHV